MKTHVLVLACLLVLAPILVPGAPLDFAPGLGEKIRFSDRPAAIGMQSAQADQRLYFRSPNGFQWYTQGSHVDSAGQAGPGGTLAMTLAFDGTLFVDSVIETSDRNLKEDIEPVDGRQVLDHLLSLPVCTWSFTNGHPGVRNIGPMAQDFFRKFKLGADDKHIASRNAAGVALAAIQGLNRKLEEELQTKEARIKALEKSVAELKEFASRLQEASGPLLSPNPSIARDLRAMEVTTLPEPKRTSSAKP